jgi:hypothetical protein
MTDPRSTPDKAKQAAKFGAGVGLLAAIGAFFGPFWTSEAIEGTMERVRRSFGARRRKK